MKRQTNFRLVLILQLSFILLTTGFAQESPTVAPEPRLKDAAGYEAYQEMTKSRRKLAGGGRVNGITWSADGKSVAFKKDGKKLTLDLESYEVSPYEETEAFEKPTQKRVRKSPVGRAQQRTVEISPDKKWRAVFQDNNVVLKPNEEDSELEMTQVTSDGNTRHRFGTGCWVYGEELNQKDAMWWSPDSKQLAFYEMDERHMKDYHLTVRNTEPYTELLTVRYPKAGDDNPKVGLWVYHLDSKQLKRLDVEGELMQYLFNIRFSPSGEELLVNRTNRWQNQLDILAINTTSGFSRVVVSEKQETWQENNPGMRFLEDQKRFIWETEENGYKHFVLRNLDGELLNPISKPSEYPCSRIVKVDEEAGELFYTAFSAENPYNTQLHRAKLDGSEDVRVTSSELNHTSYEIAPDHSHVLSVREQCDTPPTTVVYNRDGEEVAVLNEGDRNVAEEMKLSPPELFSFLADDGETKIYGVLHKPSNFDESKTYPLVIDVYGGPQSGAFRNSYRATNPLCEFGFVVAKIGNRGTTGRGKAFESSTYLNLGGPDLQDQADGVKYLAKRPYIDGNRVGIYGHSYGGYMSALALLRHPDVFQVGIAGAPVTTWKNYDTIYTERYMRTPQENKNGYEAGSCMKYVKNLKGRLLLVHGLIDDNVHPANTWQLAKALQMADQRFDMMIYPGFKHGIGSTYRSLVTEYLIKHLKPGS